MDPKNTQYLGDGLYAHFDGWQIQLFTERENGTHSVYLEREVYENLKTLAKLIGWEA